jgi:hypothetical protein
MQLLNSYPLYDLDSRTFTHVPGPSSAAAMQEVVPTKWSSEVIPDTHHISWIYNVMLHSKGLLKSFSAVQTLEGEASCHDLSAYTEISVGHVNMIDERERWEGVEGHWALVMAQTRRVELTSSGSQVKKNPDLMEV